MTRLSLIMPYYMNPGMLELQYERWAKYSQDIKGAIDVVLVDDGSPKHRAADVPRPAGLPPLSIYRVKKDIPWNQHGARNLGAKIAQGDWLLLTDMDHAVPEESMVTLLNRTRREAKKECSRNAVYTFDRVDYPTMQPTRRPDGSHKPHPNTFFLTKSMYWEIGGYDEEYCGIYGTDGLFRHRMRERALVKHLNGVQIIRYGREHVADAATTTLPRKEGKFRLPTKRIKEQKVQEGRRHDILIINFEWEQVL
ncbi:MAG: glycosyltransferase family A protein [Phycisphaerales bacterium]